MRCSHAAAVLLLLLALSSQLQQAAAGACDDQCRDDQDCFFPSECRAVTRLGCTVNTCSLAPCAQGCAPGAVCSQRVCKLQKCPNTSPALWLGAVTVPGNKDGSCPDRSHCDAISGVCLPGAPADAVVFVPDAPVSLGGAISAAVDARPLLSNDQGGDGLRVTRIVRVSRYVTAKVNAGMQQIIVSRSGVGYALPSSGASNFVYYTIQAANGAEAIGRLDITLQPQPKPSTTCAAGTHWCGSSCAADTSIDSCGLLCSNPCPAPENGKAVCLSGLCDIACNDNFIKEPTEGGFVCKRITPVGTLSMPGDYSIWVGGFNVITGWNGNEWQTRYPDAFVTGIAVAGKDYAVAVGGPVFYIFNAGLWSAYATPTPLFGAAAGPDLLWMVGEAGTVWTVTNDFTQFANQVPGVPSTLLGVAATGPGSAVAVGEQGTIVRLSGRDPSGWRKVSSGTSETLNAVKVGGGAVWAVGNRGTILSSKGDGGAWLAHKSGTTQNLFDICVVNEKLAWAVGDEGTILKYDGTSWSVAGTTDGRALYAVHAWSAEYAMAFGDQSIVMSFDGSQWTLAADLGVGAYLAVGVLPEKGPDGSLHIGKGRKLQQAAIIPPPGTSTLTPALSLCATNGVLLTKVSDPTYTKKTTGSAKLLVPICPSGSSTIRCRSNAAGKVLCDQSYQYEGCDWKTSGNQVTSGSGACPNTGPFCGTISGSRRSFQSFQGITPGTLGTGFKVDASGSNVPLDTAAMFAPCVLNQENPKWPADETEVEKAKRILLELKPILAGDWKSVPKSNNLSTWNADTNPCPPASTPLNQRWDGIACNLDNTAVVGIKVAGTAFNTSTRLQGKVPDGLVELATLESIDLSNNNLTGTVPGIYGQLSDLTTLNLAGNRIDGTLPAELSKAPKLWKIFLANNSIDGTLPVAWGDLPCLKDASCRPTAADQMVDLSSGTLDLSNNVLEGALPPNWGLLGNLATLNLAANVLTGPLPASFSGLRLLQKLLLFDNSLTGNLPASWSAIGADRSLGTSGLQIANDLREIHLSQNELAGTVPGAWSAINPRMMLVLSFYNNDQLEGCLPVAWGDRGPTRITQLVTDENPGGAKAVIVTCLDPFNTGACVGKTPLEPGKGGLKQTKITGWCPK